MKLITAIISEKKLDRVREELIESGIDRITVANVAGHGSSHREEIYRGKKVVPDLTPKIRIDIALNDDFVEKTIELIINAARTGDGQLGDGKIFVRNLEDCIRIRTGERGTNAI